jgi:dihydrofolate reductase
MRKLAVFMHTTLDGFVAGPKGEMDWIIVNEDMFEYASRQTDQSDTALYGRVTYQMMDSYWPTAGEKPNASKHDKQHSSWYNKVEKMVFSRTMKGAELANTTIVSENAGNEILKLKNRPGKDIVVFGSPSVVHFLVSENLIDDYWLFVNPILLGQGIPLFKEQQNKIKLKLSSCNSFASGVVCLHYQLDDKNY